MILYSVHLYMLWTHAEVKLWRTKIITIEMQEREGVEERNMYLKTLGCTVHGTYANAQTQTKVDELFES